jgi:hypothetical protein
MVNMKASGEGVAASKRERRRVLLIDKTNHRGAMRRIQFKLRSLLWIAIVVLSAVVVWTESRSPPAQRSEISTMVAGVIFIVALVVAGLAADK